jgi:YbbR domain-containing protein
MKPEKFFRRTRKDIWLFRAVALVISIILWITVLGGERVEINKVIYLDYQTPEHLMISNNAPREMTIRVAGPQAFIKDFETRKITKTIDLTKAEQREYEVSITDQILDLPLGLHIVSIPQQSIMVRLDRAAWKRVPVRASFQGNLPEGFRVSNVTLKPSTVEIRGPESRLRSIDSLLTEGITLATDSLIQEFDVRLSLREHPGVIVEEQNQQVNVTVQIEGSLIRRSLDRIPVRVRLAGGDGRRSLNLTRSGGVKVTPSEVTFLLEGPEDLMKNLSRANVDVWAEIPEASEGPQRVRLDWGLPPGVRVVKRSTDWVEVFVPAPRNR